MNQIHILSGTWLSDEPDSCPKWYMFIRWVPRAPIIILFWWWFIIYISGKNALVTTALCSYYVCTALTLCRVFVMYAVGVHISIQCNRFSSCALEQTLLCFWNHQHIDNIKHHWIHMRTVIHKLSLSKSSITLSSLRLFLSLPFSLHLNFSLFLSSSPSLSTSLLLCPRISYSTLCNFISLLFPVCPTWYILITG